MNQPIRITLPPGRIVQGDPNKPNTTDTEGNPLIIKNGPNAGQSRVDWYLGIAIPKNDPGVGPFFQKLQQAAAAVSGNKVNSTKNGQPNYAWKYLDGDQYPDRAGHPGHWIIKTSTGYQPTWYRHDGGKFVQMDPREAKRGDYVQVAVTVKDNTSSTYPGLILNTSGICFLGYGEEIVTGPPPSEMFDANAPMPVGASATPVAPAAPMPGQQAMPMPGQQAMPMPGQQAMPMPGQQAMPMPGQQAMPMPRQQAVMPMPMPGQQAVMPDPSFLRHPTGSDVPF